MKIQDMLKSAGRIALIYGEAGVGKTHLSSSFKGKIKIIAAEPNGIQTLEKLPAEVLDRIDVELLPQIDGDKKDKSREVFDRSKLFNGMLRACEKRPVTLAQMEGIVDDVERGLNNMMEKEVSTQFIGEVVMDRLKDLDEVAYVRFASVYRQFKDVSTFIAEIEKLLGSDPADRKKLKKLAEAEKK
jgi:transcriptional regulator NrdR